MRARVPRRPALAPLLLTVWLPAVPAGCAGAPASGAPGGAPDGEADGEVDPLGLAALLIRDGHHDRARAVLDGVAADAPGIDRPRLHLLRGLVLLHAGEHAAARDALAVATAGGAEGAVADGDPAAREASAGAVEPIAWLYLAQACLGADDPAGAVAALERAPAAWAHLPAAHRLAALARWRAGDRAGALAALTAAERAFPDDPEPARLRVLYLLELGLHQAALGAGEAYLARAGQAPDAHLALGEALRRARRPDDAAAVLEAGRLRAPADVRVRVALAHAHLDAGRPRAAAVVLEEAARLDPALLAEAAELHRRAGALDRALWLNATQGAQAAKARQRLGLLLERAAYDQAAALEPRLSRLGLLEDEEVRYALAYACYRAGDLERADARLRGLTRPELFAQATALRRAIEAERGPAAEEAR